jgi:hypothetical protein
MTRDRLVVLGAVFVGEHVEGGLRGCEGRRAVNLAKVCLHDLDREGDLVQHVGGLVNPTPLVPGAGKDLLNRLPEAERTVADREVGRDLEPTSLDVDCALSRTPVWKPTSSFLPSGVAPISTSMHSAVSSTRACC